MLNIRFGQKFFYCVITDRVIGLLLFFLKASLSFDPRINDSFKKGAFEPQTNEVLLYVMLSVLPAVWIVFFFFRTLFVFQLFLITGIVVLLLWFFFYIMLRKELREDRQIFIKRVLCGLNEPLNQIETNSLMNMGFFVTNEMIGFGTYGTTYKCGSVKKPDNHLALKVIDITEWQKNRMPTTRAGEYHLEIEKIRTNFLRVVRKLRAFDDENIVKFVKIHNEAGAFHRIYLITSLAEMNLDTFLTQYKPNGVSEQWARLWFKMLCKGLFYLHEVFDAEPFPHSNIKPENILLYRKKVPDPLTESHRFHFGRTDRRAHKNDGKVSTPENKVPKSSIDMRDEYILRLTDCGFDSFLPLGGKVVTKRNPPVMLSPPKRVIGKRYLRILTENTKEDEKKFDDIYQMGVILLLLLKGDITRLLKKPIDTERIHNKVTGVDAIYVRFDKTEIIKKLVGDKSPELILLLRKMMDWEPLLRYDIRQVIDSEWMKADPQNAVN